MARLELTQLPRGAGKVGGIGCMERGRPGLCSAVGVVSSARQAWLERGEAEVAGEVLNPNRSVAELAVRVGRTRFHTPGGGKDISNIGQAVAERIERIDAAQPEIGPASSPRAANPASFPRIAVSLPLEADSTAPATRV